MRPNYEGRSPSRSQFASLSAFELLDEGAFMGTQFPAELHRSQTTAASNCSDEKALLRIGLLGVAAVLIAAALGSVAVAAVKKVAYPEVKVTVNAAYKPDAAFEKMRTAFADAVAKKDAAALAALIAPMFLWTIGGQPADELDLGRDAIHNFKVVFGFRALGGGEDGAIENGPYWEALAAFAGDPTYYSATDAGNLVCGPIAADVADDNIFEQARKKVETGDDGAVWFFTLANTDVTKSPGDAGAPVGKVGTVALPMLSLYPPAKEGQPAPQPAYIEVLLPSGKSGWIPAAAVRPLFTERLCYARTPSGDWKIAAIDQVDQ
jgi:hypothetical protein